MTNEGYNDETDSTLNTEEDREILKKALDEEKAKAEAKASIGSEAEKMAEKITSNMLSV